MIQTRRMRVARWLLCIVRRQNTQKKDKAPHNCRRQALGRGIQARRNLEEGESSAKQSVFKGLLSSRDAENASRPSWKQEKEKKGNIGNEEIVVEPVGGAAWT